MKIENAKKQSSTTKFLIGDNMTRILSAKKERKYIYTFEFKATCVRKAAWQQFYSHENEVLIATSREKAREMLRELEEEYSNNESKHPLFVWRIQRYAKS